MAPTEPEAEPTIPELMERIRATTKLIVKQQRRADRGLFKDIGAAIGLQVLRAERLSLQRKLPPLRIIE